MFNIKNKKSNRKSASGGIEFDFSNPNIAYLGGGGKSGGTVVQTTNPIYAEQAGALQSAAANQASQQYESSIQSAIQAINNQYNQAQYAVQPYQQTGVAALDQLNQYLGLPAYNPGKAPTDPNTWNPTAQDVKNYVRDNSYVTTAGRDNNIYTAYTGVGSAYDGWSKNYQGGPNTGLDLIGYGGQGAVNADQTAQINSLLKQQYVQNNIDQYNTNLDNYNVNKDLYNKYTAAGPLTTQQITDKITNEPGYQAQLDQGTAAIAGNASAKGYLGSGKILKELSNYGQNTLSQYYGNELSRLANLVGQGANTAASLSQSHQQQGNSLADLYNSLGQTKANSTLAGSNALAQGIINANQQFQVLGQTETPSSGLSGIGSLLGGIGSLASSFGL
jgi:hypothetical protein